MFSWNKDWEPNVCPECGQKLDLMLHWREQIEGQIYEHVPGYSMLISIDAAPEE